MLSVRMIKDANAHSGHIERNDDAHECETVDGQVSSGRRCDQAEHGCMCIVEPRCTCEGICNASCESLGDIAVQVLFPWFEFFYFG